MSLDARFALDYGDFALDVCLQLPASGVSVLFGPSGSGKSSLLRCIAGLEPAARGSLSFNQQCWQNDAGQRFVPLHQRQIGMVFQEPSLFAHLDVAANLRFGWQRTPAAQRRAGWQQVIDLLGIGHLLARRPDRLSGGERQRVAIARALLASPQLLLLDEPLAALDFARKQEILPYLENLPRELDIPLIYVTHAFEEVVRLADHLLLLQQGRVVAQGAPSQVLSRFDLPPEFADEISVVLQTQVTDVDTHYQLATLQAPGVTLQVPASGLWPGQARRVRIHARDVSLVLHDHPDSSILNRLPATVLATSPAEHPAHALVRLDAGGSEIVARITRRSHDLLQLAPGMPVWAQIKSVVLL
jgi:molybdate transport system ATP-binding protein